MEPAPSRTARLFRNGSNQAVRLPRDLEIDADEVLIRREGDSIILTPKPRAWDDYFARGRRLTEDFPDTIDDRPPQTRDVF
jgi:antitoxin VapB